MTTGETTMHLPAITATYLAVLALLYAALGLRVARLRRRNRAGFGDGDNAELRAAIRGHANFAEYVPIIVLMVAMLEASGSSALTIHLLMGPLLLARVLHPIGMYAPNSRTLQFNLGRVAGVVITIAVLLAAALLILTRISLTLF
jgi:uncharacterized protein